MTGHMGPVHLDRRFIAVTVLFLAATGLARGQEQEAALAGVVRDSVGGVMPGVTVVAKSQAGARH